MAQDTHTRKHRRSLGCAPSPHAHTHRPSWPKPKQPLHECPINSTHPINSCHGLACLRGCRQATRAAYIASHSLAHTCAPTDCPDAPDCRVRRQDDAGQKELQCHAGCMALQDRRAAPPTGKAPPTDSQLSKDPSTWRLQHTTQACRHALSLCADTSNCTGKQRASEQAASL